MPTEIKKLLNKLRFQFVYSSLSGFEHYLSFLNRLGLAVRLTSVVETMPHSSNSMAGWQGLHSLTCLGEDGQLYDIDIRYAWGSEIFKQNLVAHGWSEATLLHKKNKQEPTRHKLIIYLCEDSTNLDTNQKIESVPDRFLIGGYWQSIHHIYLLLPVDHPFDIPDFDVKTRIAGYSTTCCLTKNQPKINPDSQIASCLFLPANSERQGEGGLRTKGLWKQSTPDQPLISVITVVFNGAKYIEQTIQSVINQLYDNVEYIIIDGGSTDETIEIIRKYEDYIDYWVSEPDQGIYDAMNKGIDLATGDWINFMNAGDILFNPLTLNQIREAKLLGNIIYGNTLVRYDSIHSKISKPSQNLNLSKGLPFCHQSCFVKTEIYKKHKFNLRYSICADFNLFADLMQCRENFIYHNIIISISDFNGVSSKTTHKKLQELFDVIKNNYTIYQATILILDLIIRELIKRILTKKLVRTIQVLK